MCGIIGIVGKEEVADRLVDGLRRWNIAAMTAPASAPSYDGRADPPPRARASSSTWCANWRAIRCAGTIGIAHTRWATHGAPTAANAHPHATDEVALVHNGIIENFRRCATH